jgi:hypothetical protein
MKLLKFILGVVVGLLLFYLMGSFMAWDFNPGHWDVFGRVMGCFFGTMLSIVLGVATSEDFKL